MVGYTYSVVHWRFHSGRWGSCTPNRLPRGSGDYHKIVCQFLAADGLADDFVTITM